MADYRDLKIQLDEIVINTEARMLAVVRRSIDDTIEDAQTPVAKGGRMRVKTGFLRSSGVASVNSMPTGPVNGNPKGIYTWEGDKLNLALGKMKLGDTFFFGWTARYAKHRETYDAFLETALQKWQTHVNKAVEYYRNKDASK